MTASVAIVGGGVSGLAAAYFLARRGVPSVLLEKSPRLGGLIQTDCVAGCLLEAGPDSYLAAKPWAGELARELRLDGDVIESNDAARRVFIVRSARLVELPRGMTMMVPGDWRSALRCQLFSRKTKLRFFEETFSRPLKREEDLSVGEFVEQHFGREVLDYVAEPLLTAVYGGHAAELSARSVLPGFIAYEEKFGSLIRAVRQQQRETPRAASLFLSFRDGMQSFTDAIARAAADSMRVIHAEATRVERRASAWRISYGQDAALDADRVVVACPAHVAASLLEREAPFLARQLDAIAYSSALLATLIYDRTEIAHPLDGFGFLVPQIERRTVAAVTWVSTKFPSRTPRELAAVRAFIVSREAEELLDAPDCELIDLVREDLRKFMGIETAPRAFTVHRRSRSMPLYLVGHEQKRQSIAAALQEKCGLYLIGNAYDGVGIPDCVRLAKETAKEIVGSAER